MSENTHLVERFCAAFNDNDFSHAAEIFSPDVTTVNPGVGSVSGIPAFVEFAQVFKRALPDSTLNVLRWLESGSTVIIEGAYRGTFTAPLMTPQGEVPANGRSLDLPYCDIFDIEAGRISRHRTYYDPAEMAVQLGLMPEPAQA